MLCWIVVGRSSRAGLDLALRPFFGGSEQTASLPWVAAVAADAPLTNTPANWLRERWLNYYGAAGTLPAISYAAALQETNGFFTNKFVFIGGKPITRFVGEEQDEFRIPYTRWKGGFCGGVEIMATSFLNLLRGDWLERIAPWKESLLVLL